MSSVGGFAAKFGLKFVFDVAHFDYAVLCNFKSILVNAHEVFLHNFDLCLQLLNFHLFLGLDDLRKSAIASLFVGQKFEIICSSLYVVHQVFLELLAVRCQFEVGFLRLEADGLGVCQLYVHFAK